MLCWKSQFFWTKYGFLLQCVLIRNIWPYLEFWVSNRLVPYNNGVVKNDTHRRWSCCAVATLNGEANFEWRPAAKATTQLITHVTSKYSRGKKISAASPPKPSLWLPFFSGDIISGRDREFAAPRQHRDRQAAIPVNNDDILHIPLSLVIFSWKWLRPVIPFSNSQGKLCIFHIWKLRLIKIGKLAWLGFEPRTFFK